MNLEKITKDLLKDLSPRAREVISRRFGIGRERERETLEAIGQTHGITRERVRQIEATALGKIRSSHEDSLNEIFTHINEVVDVKGGVVREDVLLNDLSDGNSKDENYYNLFLTLGRNFIKLREDKEFLQRWTNNTEKANIVHQALHSLHQKINKDDLMSEDDMVNLFIDGVEDASLVNFLSKDAVVSLLGISAVIGKNKIGEWGLRVSAQISPKGVRDLACLVLRKHGKPMHFTEIASTIKSSLGEHAHVQTVHNELIKDNKFVLVGRGLYALSSMGYKAGVVSDIIKQAIQSEGPLTKDNIIRAVMKERYVKKSTILINLQNKKYFKKLDDDTYILV